MPNHSAPCRSGLALAVLLAVHLAGLAGCAGDSDESATEIGTETTTKATGPSSAGGDPTDAGPETAPEPTSQESGSAAATAAIGPVMEIRGLSLHLPEGWNVTIPGQLSANGSDPGPTGGQVLVVAASSMSADQPDLLARLSVQEATKDGLDPVRQDNRVVGGAEGYVVTGANDLYPSWLRFGAAATNGYTVQITVRFNQAIPAAEADAYVDSILAGVTYPPA